MALIVWQHTAVDMFDVDPAYNVTNNGPIYAGTAVGLNPNGYVALAGNNGGSGVQVLGVAGDSIADEYKTTAYSADLVISPTGATRWTSNRVSDMYNETIASGKMTVYIGSGVFFTDQYDTTVGTWSPGQKVYSNASGLITNVIGPNTPRRFGFALVAPTDYPSGVPGVDDPSYDLSMSLGSFLKFQLDIG